MSACSFLGRLRARPRRGLRIGSIASTASSKTFESWTLAAEWVTASGTPRLSTTTWRFEPDLPLSVGFGPVLCPPGSRYACRVQRSPLPVDLVRFSQTVQEPPMQPLPHARLVVPFLEATPTGGHATAAAHLLGQHLPRDDPVFSTNRMPVRAARSSTRGLPPLGSWAPPRAVEARSLPIIRPSRVV